MNRRIGILMISVMSVLLLFAAPLHAITCSLSTDQPLYRGGDDMIVFLGVNFDRAATVDIYLSLSLGGLSIYWNGAGFHAGPAPLLTGVPVPQGVNFSGLPIFALPQLPFGLPDSGAAGDYTWRFQVKEASQTAASCAAPFAFECGGGVRNMGQPYLDWLPPCVRVVSTSAPTEFSLAGPFSIQLVLENTCSTTVTLTVPAGLMFGSLTLETQNLVIIKDFVIILEPAVTKTVVLPAYCVDASWHVPAGPYTIGSLAPDALMGLVNYLKTKDVPQSFDTQDPTVFDLMFGVQAEIWGLTDDCKDVGSIFQTLNSLFGVQ